VRANGVGNELSNTHTFQSLLQDTDLGIVGSLEDPGPSAQVQDKDTEEATGEWERTT
jgi:hypothetical protein